MIKNEKLKDNIWTTLLSLLLVALSVLVFLIISGFSQKEEPSRDMVGGIFIGYRDDNGWNQAHYEGLNDACSKLGLNLVTEENISEDPADCGPAINRLVKKGCKVIFLTSDGFGDNISEVTSKYSDISFFTISPESTPSNVTHYYGRVYQARYLAGIIAGSMTNTNILGYVAAKDNAQVDRGINAYLLGARSVNPDVCVKVKFTEDWNEVEKEKEVTRELIAEGADVITSHTSEGVAIDIADESGVYTIGYNVGEKERSDKFLTAIDINWKPLYNAILKDYLKGSIGGKNEYWWGISDNAVSLRDFSGLVDPEVVQKIDKVKKDFGKGNDVFSGKIVSNTGRVMCEEDERISDISLLFDMTWFVLGVDVDEE